MGSKWTRARGLSGGLGTTRSWRECGPPACYSPSRGRKAASRGPGGGADTSSTSGNPRRALYGACGAVGELLGGTVMVAVPSTSCTRTSVSIVLTEGCSHGAGSIDSPPGRRLPSPLLVLALGTEPRGTERGARRRRRGERKARGAQSAGTGARPGKRGPLWSRRPLSLSPRASGSRRLSRPSPGFQPVPRPGDPAPHSRGPGALCGRPRHPCSQPQVVIYGESAGVDGSHPHAWLQAPRRRGGALGGGC